MAFSSGLADRSDDARFRSVQSPRDESSFSSIASPLRGMGGQGQARTPPSNSDARASLHRRFTTNTVPTMPTLSPLSPIGRQRKQALEPTDYNTATFHKVQLLEKKKLEYEYLREQRRRFEAEMELIDLQAKREEDEMNRLANDLSHYNLSGHQSEPTTPPEYRDNGFPTALSRPNRFSSASLASPPDDPYEFEIATMNPRTGAAALNRNSMPVTGLDLRNRISNDLPDLASVLGHINTTSYLFGDEEDAKPSAKSHNTTASPNIKSYLQMNTTDDKFPILVRRDGDGSMQLSASSAALDLAQVSSSPGPESQSNGWSSFPRHRQAQHSLPMNTLRQDASDEYVASQSNGGIMDTPTKAMPSNRHSMEVKYSPFESKRSSLLSTPPGSTPSVMPKLQSSYSTNDIPTIKNSNGLNGSSGAPDTPTLNAHAEQHLHNHNASLGRIPPHVLNKRHSRDMSGGDSRMGVDDPKSQYRSMQSGLHASAPAFGPAATSSANIASPVTAPAAQNAIHQNMMQNYGGNTSQGYYSNPYGMNVLNAGMGNMQIGMPQNQWNNNMSMYQNPYGQYNPGQAYQQYGSPSRFPDSQARVIQQRRMQNAEDNNRFANFDLQTGRNEIYSLCKDQHGCRFLQKKIEERKPENIAVIFEETKDHVIELMTDPFGNYLCQKLFEHSNHDQRTELIDNAAPQMVKVALNQHGTRALQKMIEHVSMPQQVSQATVLDGQMAQRRQIETIRIALQDNVVAHIQDLNGNHVIQKCLNHLRSEDAQFIFDAVGAECIAVGTHRHGCCVLQRCIDHASGIQKVDLISQITSNAFALVQDPFGNYVVQYILDLNDPLFTRPLCDTFCHKVSALSRQKFSSNVIEKCIRVADDESKRILIEELITPDELDKLLKDAYANYVIQTALDYADDEMARNLIAAIRPLLPSIRTTPFGRRIQSKLQERDMRLNGGNQGFTTMAEGAAVPASAGMAAPFANNTPVNPSMAPTATGNQPSIAQPQPHRVGNPQFQAPLPAHVQQSFPPFGRGQPNGMNFF